MNDVYPLVSHVAIEHTPSKDFPSNTSSFGGISSAIFDRRVPPTWSFHQSDSWPWSISSQSHRACLNGHKGKISLLGIWPTTNIYIYIYILVYVICLYILHVVYYCYYYYYNIYILYIGIMYIHAYMESLISLGEICDSCTSFASNHQTSQVIGVEGCCKIRAVHPLLLSSTCCDLGWQKSAAGRTSNQPLRREPLRCKRPGREMTAEWSMYPFDLIQSNFNLILSI